MFEIFKLIYFKKPPIKKVLIKLRVHSDASVLIKCWFNKQAPQKVLIESSPGVFHDIKIFDLLVRIDNLVLQFLRITFGLVNIECHISN